MIRGELGAGSRAESRAEVSFLFSAQVLAELAEKWDDGQGGEEAGGFLSPAGGAG